VANRNVTLDDLSALLAYGKKNPAHLTNANSAQLVGLLLKVVQERVDSEDAQERAATAERERLAQAQVERESIVHFLDGGCYLCQTTYDPKAYHTFTLDHVTCPECKRILVDWR